MKHDNKCNIVYSKKSLYEKDKSPPLLFPPAPQKNLKIHAVRTKTLLKFYSIFAKIKVLFCFFILVEVLRFCADAPKWLNVKMFCFRFWVGWLNGCIQQSQPIYMRTQEMNNMKILFECISLSGCIRGVKWDFGCCCCCCCCIWLPAKVHNEFSSSQ